MELQWLFILCIFSGAWWLHPYSTELSQRIVVFGWTSYQLIVSHNRFGWSKMWIGAGPSCPDSDAGDAFSGVSPAAPSRPTPRDLRCNFSCTPGCLLGLRHEDLTQSPNPLKSAYSTLFSSLCSSDVKKETRNEMILDFTISLWFSPCDQCTEAEYKCDWEGN